MTVLGAIFGSQIEESTNGWQLAAVVLVVLATSLVYVTDGDAGLKVATALEEMSLIMVLLLAHLMVSKYYGEGTSKKTKTKLPSEDSDVEPDADSPAAENEAAVRWGPAPEGSEEFQSQEVGRLTTKIRAAVRLGDMTEAESAMNDMQDMGTKPGHLRRACWAVAYGELISGFIRIGDTRKAAGWLDAFAGAAPLIRPSTACVNSVIGALAAAGARSEAEVWVARMPEIGVRVDEETYSTLIGACARAGDADRAIHWLKEMRRSNFRPGAEFHKLVLQSGDDGEAGSPTTQAQATPAPELSWRQQPAAPAAAEDRTKATPAPELSWRQQPAAPAAAEDRIKPADTDLNWRRAKGVRGGKACAEFLQQAGGGGRGRVLQQGAEDAERLPQRRCKLGGHLVGRARRDLRSVVARYRVALQPLEQPKCPHELRHSAGPGGGHLLVGRRLGVLPRGAPGSASLVRREGLAEAPSHCVVEAA